MELKKHQYEDWCDPYWIASATNELVHLKVYLEEDWAADKDEQGNRPKILNTEVFLNHSCDEWVISENPVRDLPKTLGEVEAMMADLTEVRDFLSSEDFNTLTKGEN